MAVAHSSSPLKKLCVGLYLLLYTTHLFVHISGEEFHMKSIYHDSRHTILPQPWRILVHKNGLGISSRVFLASMGLTVDVSTINPYGWVLCKKCKPCFRHDGVPIFDPEKTRNYKKLSCLNTTYCQSTPINKCDREGNCNVALQYTNGGTLNGTLSTERFRTKMFGPIKVPNYIFICIHRVEDGFSQPSVGSVSLTRHPHSLVSQLGVDNFSYCIPFSLTKGWISFGRTFIPPGPGSITAPLADPETNFYYVQITAFTVKDGPIILIHPPYDVFMVSVGTPVTFVDPQTLAALIYWINKKVDYPIVPIDEYNLCFDIGLGWRRLKMPSIMVQFGTNGDINLSGYNYLLKFNNTVGCISFGQGNKQILGSQVQAGREISFGLSNNQITIDGQADAC